jgi:hypothetical protein
VAPEFSNDEQDIRGLLDAWRDSAERQGERPDHFWARQRTRVMSKIAEPRQASPRFAWAGIAAVVAVAVALFAPAQKPKQLQPQPAAQVQISDHDLMIALERSMNSSVPSSLAPATLLADEMNQALQSQEIQSQDQSQKAKEKHYEN